MADNGSLQEAWIGGVSTRRVGEPVQARGLSGISTSTVSRLCKDIGERIGAFPNRPLTGEWPCVWRDATCLKLRQGGRIVPVAAMLAVAANTEERWEIIGLGIGPSEAETFWTEFLRSLKARASAASGWSSAMPIPASRPPSPACARRPGNALAHVSKGQRTVVAAAIRQTFDPPDRAHAGETWRKAAEPLRARWPKLADLMDTREQDVLACIGLRPFVPQTVHRTVCRCADRRELPRQHRTKLHGANPIERRNKKVKRRADVVGIFPNEASILRLIGALLFEAKDDWQTSSRCMMVEAFAQIDTEEIDPILSINMKAAGSGPQSIREITPA